MRTIEMLSAGAGSAAMLAPDDAREISCAACPHPLSAHDVIGNRYCSATTAGGLLRGCVCVRSADQLQDATPSSTTDKEIQ